MYMYTIKERKDNKKKQEMRRRETNKLRGDILEQCHCSRISDEGERKKRRRNRRKIN